MRHQTRRSAPGLGVVLRGWSPGKSGKPARVRCSGASWGRLDQPSPRARSAFFTLGRLEQVLVVLLRQAAPAPGGQCKNCRAMLIQRDALI
jgi:hypothetical protein